MKQYKYKVNLNGTEYIFVTETPIKEHKEQKDFTVSIGPCIISSTEPDEGGDIFNIEEIQKDMNMKQEEKELITACKKFIKAYCETEDIYPAKDDIEAAVDAGIAALMLEITNSLELD